MIFFRVFNYFSRVALLEFCRFRYSEFAYDFIPSLYEYSKKGASLTHHSRYIIKYYYVRPVVSGSRIHPRVSGSLSSKTFLAEILDIHRF